MKAMLTPEGRAQNLKANFCAFEDDLTDFKDRSMTHVLRGNLHEPDLRAVLDLQERMANSAASVLLPLPYPPTHVVMEGNCQTRPSWIAASPQPISSGGSRSSQSGRGRTLKCRMGSEVFWSSEFR
jgi:hypothetical protein